MRLYPALMAGKPGLAFFKMLGSGSGEGFSLWPDWSTYAHLSVWEDDEAYHNWLKTATYQEFVSKSDGFMRFELAPYLSKGTWNGKKPFVSAVETEHNSALMAVLTRASIRKRKLISFWRNVPEVSRVISQQNSMLFQKGVGEWPLIEQATFSIWDHDAAMRDFAYSQAEHRKVVQKTRRLNWYKEEQFTRFKVLNWEGHWPDDKFQKLEEFKSIYAQ